MSSEPSLVVARVATLHKTLTKIMGNLLFALIWGHYYRAKSDRRSTYPNFLTLISVVDFHLRSILFSGNFHRAFVCEQFFGSSLFLVSLVLAVHCTQYSL